MADLFVVTELKAYLIAQAVGQAFDTAVSLTVPSIQVDTADGAPLPRTGEGGTVTLVDTKLAAAATLEAWIQETFVDIIVRHRHPLACRQIHRAIYDLLVPNDSNGGRKIWFMNDLLVEYSTGWRGEQPLPYPTEGQTDVVSRVASYRFGCRRKSLAGTPLVP